MLLLRKQSINAIVSCRLIVRQERFSDRAGHDYPYVGTRFNDAERKGRHNSER
jgi:hypothetical protein